MPAAVDRVGFPAVAAQHQGVAILAMFVPVGPPLGLPAPVQVVVVVLGELDGIAHRRIGAELAGLPVVHRVGVEDVVGLLFESLAVKDAVVATLPKEGQPGSQGHLVVGKPGVVLEEAEGEHVAVEVADRAVFALELDGDHLAHDFFQGNGRVEREDVDGVLEIAGEPLVGLQAIGHELAACGGVVVGKGELEQASVLALCVEQGVERIRWSHALSFLPVSHCARHFVCVCRHWSTAL